MPSLFYADRLMQLIGFFALLRHTATRRVQRLQWTLACGIHIHAPMSSRRAHAAYTAILTYAL